LSGNSLAVFPEASEFNAAALQKIARELNLTETALVLPSTRSDCAARVRIFAPAKELPYAGHPTVGTAFVLLQKGIVSSSCHEFLLKERVSPDTAPN
jgi:trans-2,3-dihydro-3-hydroxyanthranilate isomerase